MANSKKMKIFKIIIFGVTILILIGLTAYLFPIIQKLFQPEGRDKFKAEIQKSGLTGIFLLFSLQAAQIFLPILPGEPLEILAGMCFGTAGGTIFITTSAFITTTIIFFMVKKFGRKFVYEIFSKERIEKIENSKLFKNPKKLEYIMIILFLIPGTPKDLLVYIAGLLPINSWRFILISTFARFPSVISSTIAGDTLVEGNWKIGVLIYGLTFVIVGIIIAICNKLDKTKLTDNIIKNVKETNF